MHRLTRTTPSLSGEASQPAIHRKRARFALSAYVPNHRIGAKLEESKEAVDTFE